MILLSNWSFSGDSNWEEEELRVEVIEEGEEVDGEGICFDISVVAIGDSWVMSWVPHVSLCCLQQATEQLGSDDLED